MRDESGRHLGEIVPIVRGDAGVAHPMEVRMRCFELYSTVAARNCAHVARLIAQELASTGEPVPTDRTIRSWATDEAWAKQADDLWRNTTGWAGEQLRAYVFANALLSEKNRHDIQLGLYAEDPQQAAVLLKAGELADRKQEKIFPLDALRPPDTATNDAELSNSERQQRAFEKLKDVG